MELKYTEMVTLADFRYGIAVEILWDEPKRIANLDATCWRQGKELDVTRKPKLQTEFQPGRGYTKEDWDAVDSPELTDEELSQMRPFREVFPEMYEALRRARGRPRVDNPKEAVTLRIDPDTVAKFKAKGADWRAKMAEALDKAAG